MQRLRAGKSFMQTAQAKHMSNRIKGPPLDARLLFESQFSVPGAEERLSEREATVAP
jgi:hypothetical protein